LNWGGSIGISYIHAENIEMARIRWNNFCSADKVVVQIKKTNKKNSLGQYCYKINYKPRERKPNPKVR